MGNWGAGKYSIPLTYPADAPIVGYTGSRNVLLKWDFSYNLRYTKPILDQLFHNVYRFRMSEMKGDHELNWHIDADTSVICRAQICLNQNDSVLEFRDKEGVHQLKMNPGEIWFINTGWNHRVVNGETIRRSAILGFHFNDLKNKDLLLL